MPILLPHMKEALLQVGTQNIAICVVVRPPTLIVRAVRAGLTRGTVNCDIGHLWSPVCITLMVVLDLSPAGWK
ncbi:hypothetical protein AXF42_Ash015690 [Apostasia shenzhenica]|uniref:Uncharacterized protein n=1 Tax=Apostasia shenzhenica TaxID=1088818 RepID=A0A2H9ZU30_9ASPA|nr:hypothetical protein AXF42_Ash015690 [Apostasia shenzhenica]